MLLAAPFLAQADATIANVATPAIQTDLGASGTAAELVVGGYLIAFAVLVITGARLGQTHGYKRLYLLGIGVFALTSRGCGLAPNPAVLVLMRVLQGTGAALMFPQALTGIQLNFTGWSRVRAIGFYAIALSVGAVLGQILGGVLISADIAGLGWRTIFLVNVPICLAVIAAAARYLPPRPPTTRCCSPSPSTSNTDWDAARWPPGSSWFPGWRRSVSPGRSPAAYPPASDQYCRSPVVYCSAPPT
ncbi:MAG: MFS transporter [Actinomycetota bacterium]|nr:MFS transporter [Actinomycetota bacterium]